MILVLGSKNVRATASSLAALIMCACTDPGAATDPPEVATEATSTQDTANTGPTRTEGAGGLTVWIVDALTRVQPTDPPGRATAASIKAARNEYEAFQLVIRAPNDAPLRNTNVAASPLVGPNVIPSTRIALYREHYVKVTTPSRGSPYPAGWWPDALIPFVHPATGQPLGGRFPAAPFPVPAGQNQPIWVEVHVPPDTQPGVYSGELTVSAEGKPPATIAMKLSVWNFALPQIPTLHSWFGQLDVPAPVSEESSLQYRREILRHRVSPVAGWATPVVHPDGSIDTSRSHAALVEFLSLATTWTIPFWANGYPFRDPLGADRARTQRYFQSIQEYLRAHGWLERGVLYLYDEPDDPAKARVAQDYGRLVREAAPDLRTLVTTPIRADFYDLVRLWVPPFDRYDSTASRARRSRGEVVWSYTAGVRGGAYPTWQLDYPLFHYRIPAWINWSVGATGLLYWATNYWAESSDPWTDPVSYGSLNGDGALVYPGSAVGYDGPIASMRLKAIRDGIDDYDNLRLLEELDKPSAGAAARTVGVSFSRWSQKPADVLAARERIGERLHTLTAARQGGSAPSRQTP